MSRIDAYVEEQLDGGFAERLVAPDGSVITTDASPLSIQELTETGWRHEALVRSGTFRRFGRTTSADVVVKTRYLDRLADAQVHHRNETAALRLMAPFSGQVAIPALFGSWAEKRGRATGRLHIVMSSLRGVTLRDLARDRASQRAEPDHPYFGTATSGVWLLTVFAAVAARLAQLHAAGWLLNDVNTGSIMVDVATQGRTAIGLVDFGQASPRDRPTPPGVGDHYPDEILDLRPSSARDVMLLAATLKAALRATGHDHLGDVEALVQRLLEKCPDQPDPACWFAAALGEMTVRRQRALGG